jgi:hypothetical protein
VSTADAEDTHSASVGLFQLLQGQYGAEHCHVAAVNVVFPTGSATFSFKQFLIYTHEAEWAPFQTNYYSANLVALGIEHVTSGSVARNSDHYTIGAVVE